MRDTQDQDRLGVGEGGRGVFSYHLVSQLTLLRMYVVIVVVVTFFLSVSTYEGVSLNLSYKRLDQTFSFPIALHEDPSWEAVVYGSLIPVRGCPPDCGFLSSRFRLTPL